ncbi:MAG: DUF1493 family protein [Microscillaceae bacterium]|nr:DUF1493 family protein [Microscillaceae bacterium]
MKLTLNNLISFFSKEYPYDLTFTPKTEIREYCSTDGITAVYLLESLEEEFNVSFENFEFYQYFFDEAELNTFTLKSLFSIKRQRKIEKELTIQILYDYMINNVKN